MAMNAGRWVPPAVRMAAGMLLLYGFLVVANALLAANASGQWGGMLRPAIRFIGVAYVAWCLVGLQKWAWWVAVVGGLLFAVFGALGSVSLLALRGTGRVGVSDLALGLLAVSFVPLFIGAGALLTRDSRAAFGIGQAAGPAAPTGGGASQPDLWDHNR